ncbi:two-component system response regulator [Rhodopirellula sp. SWK7]|uniref:response regulator n=1 Tax=Rhodopirellula sp. SWK7 TaxID=595460 RepID=UPI0002BFB8BA|nr:response regulator [Rhodopirellula sp. SWK7]EMI46435.1 two-component response regulator [Rhodopirellula sp. SWK7]
MSDSSIPQLLLVEPETILADLTAFRLELLGYGIETVSEGGQAKDRLRRGRFDLMIVDTKLPEGDGIEWLTELRLETKAEDLPVLMFSLDPSLETVRRAFLAGAQDYLVTPFDPTVLETKVQILLSASGGLMAV